MKKNILFLVVMFLGFLVQGEKLGVLTEILKPEGIEVSEEKLYVVEGSTFFVYSLKNLQLLAKFGQKGEGPGELTKVPFFSNSIRVLNDKLMVEGHNKVLFFSKNFKYLKEIRKKGTLIYNVTPIGENFVACRLLSSAKDNRIYSSLSLYDSTMNVIKDIYKQEIPERGDAQPMLPDSIHFAIYKGKIFVEKSDKGFLIEVLDSKGNKLFEIKNNFEVKKVTEKDKNTILKEFKKDAVVRMVIRSSGGWENFKKSINFLYPDTFPQIQDIIVTDDKIYVSTYHTKGNKEKYIVMDLKGNIVSTHYLSIPPKSSFTIRASGAENRFYAIRNNKFYYLVENEDDEEWELHVTAIK